MQHRPCVGYKEMERKTKKRKKKNLSDSSRGCLTMSCVLLMGNDGNVGGFDKLCL